jgi:hypothetical protein
MAEPSGRIPAEYAALARQLRGAEDRLFPLAMIDADRYQRAVRLVGLLSRRLSETCASLDDLAAAGPDTRFRLTVIAGAEGIPLDGLDPDLVADAAMSQRFRELLAEHATELRQQRIERARAAGLAWAVIEEPDPAAWGTGAARWVDVHVATGAVLVRSVAADPNTGTPTFRIEVFGNSAGAAIRVEEFTDRSAWLAAIDRIRAGIEAEIES